MTSRFTDGGATRDALETHLKGSIPCVRLRCVSVCDALTMRKKSYRSKHIRCVTFHVSVCDACAYPIAVRVVSDEILIAFGANFDADAQQSYLKIETRHLASGRQGRAASAFSLFIYYIRSKSGDGALTR